MKYFNLKTVLAILIITGWIVSCAFSATTESSINEKIDKKGISEKIDKLLKKDKKMEILSMIDIDFLYKRQYNQAQFAYKYLKKQDPDFFYRYLDSTVKLCLSYMALGEKTTSEKCLWTHYLRISKYTEDYVKKNRTAVEKEFDLYLIRKLNYPHWFRYFPGTIPYLENQIDKVLSKYKDIREPERNAYISIKKFFSDERKRAEVEYKRKIHRRKQIDTYLRELEKLLVLKDEQKLREFLEKYMDSKTLISSMRYYKKYYWDKNYRKISFEIIQNPKFYKTGDLQGVRQESIASHCYVKTNPPSKGENCPEIVDYNEKPIYCYKVFNFKFIDNKIEVN